MCFGFSKVLSHCDSSLEYPKQNNVLVEKLENKFLISRSVIFYGKIKKLV